MASSSSLSSCVDDCVSSSVVFIRRRQLLSFADVAFVIALLINFNLWTANAFNVDTKAPIIKYGRRDSYFGFSLAPHLIQNQGSGEVSPWILVGAPRDNITDPTADEKVRQLVRPGAVFQCPFTSNTDDCVAIKVDREVNPTSEDKNDQWLGVSVASQGTEDGKAMVCAHRYKLWSSFYRWGVGQCVTLTNALDEDEYYQPCEGRSKQAGHGEYGFCQAGISATLSADGDMLMGAPGPYNWRGMLFKNQLLTDSLLEESEWIPSPVEDPTPTNPGPDPATVFYSYLGMSVKIAKIDGKKWYIGGAPRSKLFGQVLLFQQKGNSKMLSIEQQHILNGEQFGAGFGYDIAVADFNLDQKEDLVVSAPFYHAQGVGGAIYIYYNSAEGISRLTEPQVIYSRKMKDQECAQLSCQDARFGYALSSIGDIDRDGFQDLAVGAPYEGTGAVYIFRGSARGLMVDYSQRIAASEFVGVRLSAFGASLGGGSDFDNNGYPDLIVGAFSSDTAVILRSRPVVNIEVELTTTPSVVDPQQKTCTFDGTTNVCFQLQACFRFTAEPRERFNKKMEVLYRLDAEKLSSSNLARAVFVRRRQNKLSESSVVESSVMMREQSTTPTYDCETHIVYIAKTNRDFLNPIQMLLTYKLMDYGDPQLTPGQPLQDINGFPVLNTAVSQVNYSIDFIKNCGNDLQCHSSLSADASLSLKRDNSHYILRVGQITDVVLTVAVNNVGEDAHETSLYVMLPDSIDYRGADSLKENEQYTCTPIENFIHCSIGNPLSAQQDARLSIRLDMQNVASSSEPINITVIANTTSIEVDQSNDRVVLPLIVIVETDLLVNGRSDPQSVVFGGEIIGESAVEFEDKLGAEVNHVFEVRNNGSASVSRSHLTIKWPYALNNGQHILYLLDEPVIVEGSDTRGYCNYEQAWINPLGIKPSSRVAPSVVPPVAVVDKSSQDQTRRTRRDAEPAAIRTERRAGQKNVARLNCDDHSARCHEFRCEIGKLEPKGTLAVKFRSRLWNSTFLEHYSSYDEVQISSRIEVTIDPSLNIKQSNYVNDVLSIHTYAIPDILIQGSPGIPLWIIIVAIIIGIILLALIIVILWRCGFFRRHRNMATHKAKKKHGVEDYHD